MDAIIFNVQLVISIVVYGLLFKWYAVPWLDTLPRERALSVCLLPQAFRHLGLYGLVAAAYVQFPESWANTTAVGDLSTQIASMISLALLYRRSAAATPAVWTCNVIGVVGATASFILLSTTNAPLHSLYSAWFLPVFYLPLLLWSHVYCIRFLLRAGKSQTASAER